MDPLTQGVLGASLPQAVTSRDKIVSAGILGFLAGMAPDLDVFIRSSEDSLLFLEFHRQFTHALVFIPFGGLICALVLHGLISKRSQLSFKFSLLFCTLGYATHAVLDSCTTYGTMLFWPFSDVRIAWNIVSVIDPLITVPVLTLMLFATIRKSPLLARLALVWVLVYLSLGLMNRNRAMAVGEELALSRGHVSIRLEAKPSFANILIWKVIYETSDRYYVDAVRAGLSSTIYAGDSVEKLDIARDLPWLDMDSQQARDIERFRWFSNGYVARDPQNSYRVIDIRYSMLPNEVKALWSIELRPEASPTEHARYQAHRDARDEAVTVLWQMIKGEGGSTTEQLFGGG
ncbi:MAG: inner membrane protein [Alcanivorax sp.]|jgi:inner membrane protein